MNGYRNRDVFESPNSTAFDFCLRGSMKSEVYKRKVDTSDEMLARVLDDAARKKNVKYNSDEQHAIFAHQLQNALTLKVGFWKTYCKL